MLQRKTWLHARLWAVALFSCASAESDVFATFRKWLLDRGVVFTAQIEFGVDEATGLRGLLAPKGAANGTEVFRLPRALVLTTDDAREKSSTWSKCSAEGKADDILSPVHTAFSMFLLEQRAEGSEWKPWVDVLPSSFDSFPLFWGEKEINELQSSPLRKVIELDRDAVGKDHRIAEARTPGLGTLEDFKWARSAVKSRVFGLKTLSNGALTEEIVSMVPLADFVNHPPEGVAENVRPSYDVETGVFKMVAIADIAPGAGIYWDYGFKSNRNSLQRYGFASEARIPLTDMPLMIRLTNIPGDASPARSKKFEMIERERKASRLMMEENGSVLHELSLSLGNQFFRDLIGHMRFHMLQPAKNLSVLEDYCGSTYCRPVSLANERQALHHLVELLTQLADQYPTSAAEDKEMLSGDQGKALSEGQRNAVIIRIGEKKILKGFGNVVRAIDPLFDLSPWALAKTVGEKWTDARSDIHGYVRVNLTALVEQETVRWYKRRQREAKSEAAA